MENTEGINQICGPFSNRTQLSGNQVMITEVIKLHLINQLLKTIFKNYQLIKQDQFHFHI